MVVTENNEMEQISNSEISNKNSNTNSNSYEHQYNANLNSNNHSNSIEKNSLLSNVNKSNPDILTEENQMKKQKMNGFNKEIDRKKISINDPEIGSMKEENVPPDGGIRAWSIMFASFFINGIFFSIINSNSLIHTSLTDKLKEDNISDASGKASIAVSLQLGTTFGMSPIAGILTNKIGIQMTTFLGGLIASLGMFLSSFVLDKIELMCLTYGVMYGIGASLAYAPSLVILGHYFKRYLGIVNGIVTAGSSIFTMLMPFLLDYIIKNYGLKRLMIILGFLTCCVMACAYLFKPIEGDMSPVIEKPKNIHKTTLCAKLKSIVNLSILKRKRYLIWAIIMPFALVGYQVPYLHIGNFVVMKFGPNADTKLPIMCIGITSGIGRLVFGYIADFPRVNKIFLQQIAFTCLGGSLILLSVITSYEMLIAIYLCIGFFDGCFISLLGPIAFETCGKKNATAAISLLLGLCALPITVGGTFAGFLYDRTKSYDMTFIITGTAPIMAALAMFLIRCVKDEPLEETLDPAGESLTSPNWQNESTSKTAPIIEDLKKDSEEKELHEIHGSDPALA